VCFHIYIVSLVAISYYTLILFYFIVLVMWYFTDVASVGFFLTFLELSV